MMRNGSTVIGQATNTSSTTYNVTTSSALVDGSYDINATYAATSNGIESPVSGTSHITIDTIAPVIAAPDLDAASNTGLNPLDNYTNDGTPTLTGSTEASATVLVLLDGTSVGPVTRNGTAFSFTPASRLLEGVRSVSRHHQPLDWIGGDERIPT